MIKMYGYIYKTTNLVTNKIYVGQHKSNKFDETYFGSGIRITNIIKKYGTKNLICELLEECNSEDELNKREIYWITTLDSTNRDVGYNLMSGGYKVRGMKHSDETKQKISESRTGIIPNRVYGSLPLDQRNQISDTLKEYYKTHNNVKKGTHLSESTKEKLRKANLGKRYSEETCAKHRGKQAWNKGIPMTDEAKQHLSVINKGNIVKTRMVGRFDKDTNRLLGVYISCAEASRQLKYLGISNSGSNKISQCCNGKSKTAYGFVWKYLEDKQKGHIIHH